MEEKDPRKETEPVITIVERRSHRESELTSTEVMRILRKRAAKRVAGRSENLAELKEEEK